MKQYKNALVIGKFMPPHKGHEYLIRFAQNYAAKPHVVVDCLEGEVMPSSLRAQWLREAIHNIEVYNFTSPMPQDPSETTEFWKIWREGLFNILPAKPDVVIASMDYGVELARQLNCDFVAADIARESIPMSATQIRDNLYDNWDYLLPSARPYFMKKLCLLGPESTGKSTAAKTLAKRLNTIYVPEYAAGLIGRQQGEFYPHNVEEVIRAQIASEAALSTMTNKIMICDSSAITTHLYAKELFDMTTDLNTSLKDNPYSAYALFYPDTDYQDDIHRKVLKEADKQRLRFFDMFQSILEKNKLPYEVIKGSYAQRDEQLYTMAQNVLKPEFIKSMDFKAATSNISGVAPPIQILGKIKP